MISFLEAVKEGKTLVFGHRGASAYRPMNTLPAFEKAAALGADGVELDVHRTTDGEIIVFHDFLVDKTTDGQGRVTNMTLAQLRTLDAGSWMGAEFVGTRIPTLDEVFEAVGRKLFINVEIKSVPFKSRGLEALVAEKIKRHHLEDRVLVSSFDPLALRCFRRKAPAIPVGYLVAPEISVLSKVLAFGMRYEAYHPNEKQITPELMTRMKQRGVMVNTWTVNDGARARALAEMGVAVIISDKPDVIRDALGR